MRKLFIAAIAVVALTLPLLADTRTNEVDGVTWQYTVTDGKATLGTGRYARDGRAVIGTPPENLAIPAEIDGMPVVEIGQWAFFWYYTELKSVTIPEGVTNIAEGAFSSCRALKRVVIPESVKSIGSRYGWYAFSNCSSLDEVVFMGDVGNIDMNVTEVFMGTPWLENQDFSLVVKNGQIRGFMGRCPETVVVPDGVFEIGYSAFSAYSFPSATNLVQVILPDSLRYIYGQAFAGCRRLVSIVIPASVSDLYSGAFTECTSLSNVTFGREDYLTCYNMTAFKGTPFFDTLPFSLKFEWRGVDGEETWTPWITDYIGKCPDNLDIEAVHVAQWQEDRQRILEETGGYDDIGEAPAISGIAERVFAGCNIKSVVLPASLSAIENGAFFDCTNMTRIVFTGNAPEEIAEDAFYVYEEGYYDEWWNWVPDHYGANTNCTVYVPANSTGWGVVPGEWRGMRIAYSTAFNVEDGVLVSVVAGEDTELTVPAGVTNIAANAFAGCGAVECLTIPDAVESIDPTAFADCGKLWAKWFKTLERLSGEDAGSANEVALTVTNVVVHYVTQSVPSEAVVPQETTGIVSVIGEVNAGAALAIPAAWAEQYGDAFTEKFGSDFAKAVTAETGKRDGAGNAMFVWQDFVAGTDPTDENDVFTASITFDAATNEPIISWTPELPASEAAKRTYKTFGKVRLTDDDWTLVNGNASAYNFFKVTVEMK